MTQAEELARQVWDVIIVGSGTGGATLGYALAKAGRRVLFCEQGRSDLGAGLTNKGAYAECFFDRPEVPQPKHSEILKASGRWWEEIDDVSSGRPRSFIPFVGAGAGGSSALYGAALERFFPSDFTPRQYHSEAPGADVAEAWPVSFEALTPFYRDAEALFRVRGGADPLKPELLNDRRLSSIPFSGASRELASFFEKKGLHPYHLPLAGAHRPGCRGCQGYLCSQNCKGDGWLSCILPAIREHGAAMLDECQVTKLEANDDAVTRAICVRRGEPLALEAPMFVLAAGALATPGILLRSTSSRWPDGLANDSGMVGRFLMRHFIDLYAVSAEQVTSPSENSKQLGLNDFYLNEGLKLGSLQSFGDMPPVEMVVASLIQDLRDGPMTWLAPVAAMAQPVLRRVMGGMFERATMLASILEDLPYADNRVTVAAGSDGRDRLRVSYRIHDYDKARIRAFRDRIAAALRPYRHKLIKQAGNNQRLAHACGTCRFGNDPARSVLDANNRAHSVSNLYVVDASFFPSSGGTNPALTIGANALRVAAHVLKND